MVYRTRHGKYEVTTDSGRFEFGVGRPYFSLRHDREEICALLVGKYNEKDLELILKALRHCKKERLVHFRE